MEPQNLPDQTFVPGWTQRPCDSESKGDDAVDPVRLARHGLELFQNGFYWEAHEIWEHLWIHYERKGPQADEIKSWIKAAAAGVKILQLNSVGAVRHLQRSRELCLQLLALTQHSEMQAAKRFFLTVQERRMMLSELDRLLANLPIATDLEREKCRTGGVPLLGPLPFSIS